MEQAQEDLDLDETDENLLNLEATCQSFSGRKPCWRTWRLATGWTRMCRHLLKPVLHLRAAVASAQSALGALELQSTLAGTVVDLSLQAGEKVSAGQPVLTVADFST